MEELERETTNRVVNELIRRQIKQIRLIALCKEAGMPISQSNISRIYSGKKLLNLYELAAISKVLKMPLDFFVWGADKHREDFCDPHESEILCDSGAGLEYYSGTFHFYYLSTALNEDKKILHGILEINEKEEFYTLSLKLETGVKNRQGSLIEKQYSGRVLVSLALGAAYITLKSESIGELCMICFRHRNYNVKDMECRVGLALTMSAGEMKEPTVHRCLLVRDEIDGELLDELRPWLCMAGDDICIEKSKWEKVLEEAAAKYPECTEEIMRLSSYAVSRTRMEMETEGLRRRLSLDRKDFIEFLSMLYKVADAPRNYKITQSDDMRIYEKIDVMQERKSQEYIYDKGEGG